MIVLEVNSIIIYLGCIIALFLIGRIFIIPLKKLVKLILNSILGGILIFIINLIGGMFGFHIGLNIATALTVGILGIPRSYFANSNKNLCRIKLNNKKSLDILI